jgi:hypothetical protein
MNLSYVLAPFAQPPDWDCKESNVSFDTTRQSEFENTQGSDTGPSASCNATNSALLISSLRAKNVSQEEHPKYFLPPFHSNFALFLLFVRASTRIPRTNTPHRASEQYSRKETSFLPPFTVVE